MKKLLILILTLAILCVCATVTFGNEYHFAKYGLGGYGARADALGGAFLAVADDGFASSYNPAGITQLKGPVITGDFGLITQRDPSDYQIFSGFGGMTTPLWAVNLSYDCNIHTLGPTELSTTSFNFIYSRATPLSESTAWGGSVKLVCDVSRGYDSKITFDGANVVFDSGWLMKTSDVFSWGVVARDIGLPILPTMPTLAVGCAYRESSSTIIAADVDLTILSYDSIILPFPFGHLGIEEYIISDVVALRLGFSGFPADGYYAFTGGLGVKILGVNADLAVIGLTSRTPGVELSASYRL